MTADPSGTTRLYWEDSFLDTFTATVLGVREIGEETWGVVLDRTAFYPEEAASPVTRAVWAMPRSLRSSRRSAWSST